jgi:hypothetical protein
MAPPENQSHDPYPIPATRGREHTEYGARSLLQYKRPCLRCLDS